MCYPNTGKITNGHTFLITITENLGFSFRGNCLWLEFNWWNDWGYKKILRNRGKHKECNFSCEPYTKYVGKPFIRHSIWSLASLGSKSHGTRERLTQYRQYFSHLTVVYRITVFFCGCKFLRFVSKIGTYNFCDFIFCDFTPWQSDLYSLDDMRKLLVSP